MCVCVGGGGGGERKGGGGAGFMIPGQGQVLELVKANMDYGGTDNNDIIYVTKGTSIKVMQTAPVF